MRRGVASRLSQGVFGAESGNTQMSLLPPPRCVDTTSIAASVRDPCQAARHDVVPEVPAMAYMRIDTGVAAKPRAP